MSKKEYKFNPETLTYEPVERPVRLKRYENIRRILLFFLVAALINLVYSTTFYTPKLYHLEEQGAELVHRFDILSERITATGDKLGQLRQRDNYVYRSLFGADTLHIPGVYAPYEGKTYLGFNDDYDGIVLKSWQLLDAQSRLLYRQSVSLDQLQVLSKDKEKMAASIPAI